WVNGKAGATIRTPGGTDAANTLADWAKKGYLPERANASGLTAAVAEFTRGKGLFLFDGSWDAQNIDRAMHGRVGFIPFPGGAGGRATGIGTSVAYAIPAKAKNPDLAAAFLDFMNTPEAAQIQFNTGFLPLAHADSVKGTEGNVMNDIASAWGVVNKGDGLVNFFANSTATMNDTLTIQTQRLIESATTGPAFLDALQSDWARSHERAGSGP
ncbi:extracellular solute-binding protein, partial [Kitasatospora sp. NPDC005751]